MKTNVSSIVTVLIILVVTLGYIIFRTRPTQNEVDTRVISQLDRVIPLNVTILDDPEVKKLEQLPAFGAHPVQVNQSNLSRRNPFEGI